MWLAALAAGTPFLPNTKSKHKSAWDPLPHWWRRRKVFVCHTRGEGELFYTICNSSLGSLCVYLRVQVGESVFYVFVHFGFLVPGKPGPKGHLFFDQTKKDC